MGSFGGNSYGGSSFGGSRGYGGGLSGNFASSGSSGYGSGSFGGSNYGGSSYGGSSYGGSSNYGGVITGAVQSRRSVSYYDVPSTYSDASPVTIDLPSGVQPLTFRMNSRSSPINIETSHEGQPGSYQETSSVDEPHVRVHNVQRPIVQKILETIQPYRQIRQEVRPVQESVEQVIARGQPQQSYGGSSYGSGAYKSGSYGGSSSFGSNQGYGSGFSQGGGYGNAGY
ncbi:PREDICTED: probable peroxisomal membrane protein PEX13 [Rhagoletis zephyria]|uniref:probable peroxisomal membrane protein PEX13 n=1 Tax=Rhagoletis zephyria TaxID=28612 RepID=UPI000811937E|nr:PREDICTED: probable peroxisomal membrane protein PEX13 [Rhagoletis zephyria]